MAGAWERDAMRPPSPARAKIALLLGAVLLVGMLARWGDASPSTGGTLDVEQEEVTRPTPSPRRSPRPTPTPAPSPSAAPSPSPSAVGELAATWEEMPRPPGTVGNEPALAWDGRRLFLFGGQTWDERGERSEFHASGWLLDIETGEWTELPAAPLDGRVRAGAAWTGAEFVVWGGMGRDRLFADGAAFDPDGDGWRLLPDSSLSPRQGAAVAWTGSELLVAGGSDNSGGLPEAGVYDPRTDRWRRVRDLPATIPMWGMPAGAVGTGNGAVVWFPEQWEPGRFPPLRYTDGEWRPVEMPPRGEQGHLFTVDPLPDGGLVALRGGWGARGMEGSVLVLPSGASEWREVTDVPLQGEDRLLGVPFGLRFLVVDGRLRAMVFDLLTDTWFRLPGVSRLGEPWTLRGFPVADGVVLYGAGMAPDAPPRVARMTLRAPPEAVR